MKATGTWVALEMPEEDRLREESDIILTPEAKQSIEAEKVASLATNILKILSVGTLVRDENLKSAKEVIVDPRMAVVVLHDEDGNPYMLAQENQIMLYR